jgi:hypothetical protein
VTDVSYRGVDTVRSSPEGSLFVTICGTVLDSGEETHAAPPSTNIKFHIFKCMYYGGKRSFRDCVITYMSYLFIFAGFEVGATYGARALMVRFLRTFAGLSNHSKNTIVKRHDRHAGDDFVRFFGIASAVLISVGLMCVFCSPRAGLLTMHPLDRST